MQVHGTIIQRFPPRTHVKGFEGKERTAQDYILQTTDQYPRKILFTLHGDDVHHFQYNVGDLVQVSFDIESRGPAEGDAADLWETEIHARQVEPWNGVE